MTLMRIRQPHSYQKTNAEVIATLCDSLQNHLHSETTSHWVWHWLFFTHQVEHNQQSLLHPSSIPSLGMFALCRKDRYQIFITPVNTKALFITICTCPSKSVLSLPFLVLSCIQIKNPAVTQRHQSSDAEAHWSWSCTSLQQTSHDGISLISIVMCSTS